MGEGGGGGDTCSLSRIEDGPNTRIAACDVRCRATGCGAVWFGNKDKLRWHVTFAGGIELVWQTAIDDHLEHGVVNKRMKLKLNP